ncbi:MAG: hypothetical protein LKK43_02435 [Lactococcus lactis]|nr:hypothetical protein [Lactococcus lactis]MCI2188832.1 hypothetical protein [Lactococcus lactis]
MTNFFAIIMVVSFGTMIFYFVKKKIKFALISLAVSFIAFFVVGFTAPNDDHKSSDSNKTERTSSSKKTSADKTAKKKIDAETDNKLNVDYNKSFESYLNNDMVSNDNNKFLINSNTMNFEAGGAVSMFLYIPNEYKSYSNNDKQRFANNALDIYQESFDIWTNSNSKKIKKPPYFYIKYKDGGNMAVWLPGDKQIEIRG